MAHPTGFRDLPLRLRALILVQGVVALALLAWQLGAFPPGRWELLGLLALCGAVGGAFKVEAPLPKGGITLGFTVTYLAFLLLGTSAALLVGLAGATSACCVRVERDPFRLRLRTLLDFRTLYNLSNCVISIGVLAGVFHALGGVPGLLYPEMALPVLASALAYYLANGAGVTIAIAWTQHRPFTEIFRTYCGGAWTGYLASASIGVGALWAYQHLNHAWVVLLFMPLAILVYYSYALRSQKLRKEIEHMQELGKLNDAIISSLAMAINAKDSTTSKHVNRVREYALSLGRKLGISQDELEAVRIASLLHDIGKIGIPERILCKPGKLSTEEFAIMKSHVEIGAAILEQVPFPWPVVPVVRGHHERWDGLGYPRGLKGEEIPIGARIISLVDVYDALTSERPYRRAMSREQAIAMLRANSGTQFDPRVVEAFIALLPEMDAVLASMQASYDEGQPTVYDAISEYLSRGEDATADVNTDSVLQALESRLECGETLHLPEFGAALLECAQQLAPCATLALYVADPLRDSIYPVYVGGQWTRLFDRLQIRLGEGVSGFVAERAEPLVGTSAAQDLARRVRPGENLELTSTLSVPLLVEGAAMGALTLYHGSYNLYQPYHAERLQRLAEVATRFLRRNPEWMEQAWPAAPTAGSQGAARRA